MGLPQLNNGLLWGVVACCFGLFRGLQAMRSVYSQNDGLYSAPLAAVQLWLLGSSGPLGGSPRDSELQCLDER